VVIIQSYTEEVTVMRRWTTLAVAASLMAGAQEAGAQIFTFDTDPVGQVPRGFTCGLTGRGKPGVWVVKADASAPSAPNVLAQIDPDATDYRFPVCVVDGISAVNVDLSVRFKPITGSGDQAAGLVWRYRDVNDYYVVRANANENNVTLYKVERGRRISLAPKGTPSSTYGKIAPVKSGQWGTLRVVVNGTLFRVFYNGQPLYDVEDATFTGAGTVGVWTKADSVTYFDDLRVVIK
jgi:hypothetical protein